MTRHLPGEAPLPHQLTEERCRQCNGSGKAFDWICGDCYGEGVVEIEVEDFAQCWDEPEGGDER